MTPIAILAALFSVGGARTPNLPTEQVKKDPTFTYPKARMADVVDDYGGIKVPDPYRWLEDPSSSETKQWVKQENELTFGWLAKLPGRDAMRRRLTELVDFPKLGELFKEGGRYFFLRNDGLQNQFVLTVSEKLGAKERVLLDPNTLSKDGTVATGGYSVTADGKLLAYSVQKAGSDWQTWKVRDVTSGRDLPDTVEWSKFSGASWTKDGKGFYYSRYDAPEAGEALQSQNVFQKLYYHRLGAPQSQDTLILEDKSNNDRFFDGRVSDDGRYLIVSVGKGTEPKNGVLIKDLRDKSPRFKEVTMALDAYYSFIGNIKDTLLFASDKDAPLGKVIAVKLGERDPRKWRTVVPEAAEKLETASLIGNRVIGQYLKDAQALVRVFDLGGKPLPNVALPGVGSVAGFSGHQTDSETFFTFQSFAVPPTLFRFDVAKNRVEQVWRAGVKFDPSLYETRQVFFSSKDGTRIPMFLTYKKGLKMDGSNPTLMYGYGGFNSSETPYFSATRVAWLERGGVYAVVNLRGGGEYGRAWHDSGRLKNKQNVFDDFISAGEYLIREKITSTPKLAIIGGSNGGLLVGAVLVQRPDLWGAAIAQVGVMDMLRFNKFTIGYAWESDYGSPQDPEMFKVLRAYSPLHNVRPGTAYPPTMILTADTDDRVVPAHSFKFAAAMQAAQTGPNPVLIRIETSAGHGGGMPLSKQLDMTADIYTFLRWALKADVG